MGVGQAGRRRPTRAQSDAEGSARGGRTAAQRAATGRGAQRMAAARLLVAGVALGALTSAQDFREILTSTRCVRLPLDAEDAVIASLKMRLYNGEGEGDFDERPLNRTAELAASPRFNASRCSAVLFTGFLTTPDTPHARALIQAYVRCSALNVLVLDWRAAAVALPYAAAVGLLPPVAQAVAAALRALARGDGRRLCHFVGHSLGAHLQSAVARDMWPTRLPSIVGLDPAFPLFYNTTLARCAGRMHAADADCVLVVHTDGGEYGSPNPVGDTDFFPNGGVSPQPGCHDKDFGPAGPVCSHNMAAWLWADAVCKRSALVARRCGSWTDFSAGACDDNATLPLDRCDGRPRSKYFLRTRGASPFGLGAQGAAGGRLPGIAPLHSAAPSAPLPAAPLLLACLAARL